MSELTDIESRFLEVTGLQQDLSSFPITELVQFPIRKDLSKSHGEVFTPPSLVDKMILTSLPQPDKFNMDLCAGRGQFTVRILRYFITHNPSFDIKNYLTQYHQFNEFNIDSCHELVYIFGKEINLAIGPAQELQNNYPETSGIWNKGIHRWHENQKRWIPVDSTSLSSDDFKVRKVSELF